MYIQFYAYTKENYKGMRRDYFSKYKKLGHVQYPIFVVVAGAFCVDDLFSNAFVHYLHKWQVYDEAGRQTGTVNKFCYRRCNILGLCSTLGAWG